MADAHDFEIYTCAIIAPMNEYDLTSGNAEFQFFYKLFQQLEGPLKLLGLKDKFLEMAKDARSRRGILDWSRLNLPGVTTYLDLFPFIESNIDKIPLDSRQELELLISRVIDLRQNQMADGIRRHGYNEISRRHQVVLDKWIGLKAKFIAPNYTNSPY